MITVRDRQIEPLFTESQIADEIRRLAGEIAAHHPVEKSGEILVVAVLKGSFVFAADLIRALHAVKLAPEVEFISLSSYGGGTEGGEVRVLRDVETDVAGRVVVMVDDILESGRTLQFARDLLLSRGATAVELAVLLDKSVKRKVGIEPDYVGFECPDHFVVGYGMDVGHAFRELPFVGRVVE
ncbi:hypoxanthine phosphoribosyltransferase [Aureimonas psammosilenae]|uniref:hypoxanthine phosphoribosyltransferase n=1 Tax=Aureimonas psammosilenae TaxID=2495496 RepID=UPI001260BC56|nr:hypoxanthine phosphoribosyltransferase [Aureimonas psammosilenae]